jgi:hypothetical protein
VYAKRARLSRGSLPSGSGSGSGLGSGSGSGLASSLASMGLVGRGRVGSRSLVWRSARRADNTDHVPTRRAVVGSGVRGPGFRFRGSAPGRAQGVRDALPRKRTARQRAGGEGSGEDDPLRMAQSSGQSSVMCGGRHGGALRRVLCRFVRARKGEPYANRATSRWDGQRAYAKRARSSRRSLPSGSGSASSLAWMDLVSPVGVGSRSSARQPGCRQDPGGLVRQEGKARPCSAIGNRQSAALGLRQLGFVSR